MKKRVGDTLVEVTLAVGIFSMVAVAVVSVISGSTSSAQGALETTLTREQIDMQAEALRFIHSSYIAGGASTNSGNSAKSAWETIRGLAIEPDGSFTNYAPTECNANNIPDKAFIVNTRALSSGGSDAIVQKSEKFFAAATYPRILYNGNDDSDPLLDNSSNTTISRVEGLYVLAVKDGETTDLVEDGTVFKGNGYFDFYIRSCWYGPGADTPSTISTVIRLYDPEAVGQSVKDAERVVFIQNGSEYNPLKGKTIELTALPNEGNKRFVCWSFEKDGDCIEGNKITLEEDTTIYAVWEDIVKSYKVNIYRYNSTETKMVEEGGSLYLGTPTREGYSFVGWNTNANEMGQALGSTITVNNDMNVYEIWDPIYMQDYTNTLCAKRASSSSITLKDRRDDSTYTVRYINGECWMTQNLRITHTKGQPEGTILGQDSNFSASRISFDGNLISGNSTTQALYRVPNASEAKAANLSSEQIGAWYNFCAASAKTVCASGMIETSQDICPANWRLPNKTEILNMISFKSEFNPVYGGYYAYSTHRVPTTRGSWWSSTPEDDDFRYGIYYDSDGLLKADSCYNPGGPYMRCVKD